MDYKLSAAHRRLSALASEALSPAGTKISDLLQDSGRNGRLILDLPQRAVHFDFSKAHVSRAVLDALLELANELHVQSDLHKMFAGELINHTEGRAVLHVALRHQGRSYPTSHHGDVMPQIGEVLARMQRFVDGVHQGTVCGVSGSRFTRVVHIGIGGSDLGPRMVVDALYAYRVEGIEVRFCSNVDPQDLERAFDGADLERTLVIVASKTFTTQETMLNAEAARAVLVSGLSTFDADDVVKKHFVALSTQLEETRRFGISDERVFPFWDWVGGRYSLWSAIGMPIALACGFSSFRSLLAGAAAMDETVRTAPPNQNPSLISALIGFWYANYLGAGSFAVLPYARALSRLPAWLQQGDMESNGKSVSLDGQPVTHLTGPLVWGEPGTDAQHSFFQLLHQGTPKVWCEFLGVAEPMSSSGDSAAAHQHQVLLGNLLAQTRALAFGKSKETAKSELIASGVSEERASELAPFKAFSGNRGSSTVLLRQLDPHHLGMLLSYYEHRIFYQGRLFGVNSFDQFGVELGKVLAKEVLSAWPHLKNDKFDPSTVSLAQWINGGTETAH